MLSPDTAKADLAPSGANFLKHDGPAGLVVFLVAMPLCLGVALASGAPLFAGVLSGIVGGCVVSVLSSSQVSVSGPAAGLAVLVATGIQTLGSYPAFLTAVVVCGVFQIALGLLRAGAFGDYVPTSVIKGMLAGIGLVIILKQLPHALGHDLDFMGDLSFLGADGESSLQELRDALSGFAPGPVVVSALSLAVLIGWGRLAKTGPRLFALVPGALVAVALGIGLNQAFLAFAPGLAIRSTAHLVSLPVPTSLGDVWGQLTFPDFSVLSNPSLWSVALTLAIVASVEGVLCVEAADRIDPYRRISSPNRELWAQGAGNVVSGLIGGLPLTSVVLRSSASVGAGSRTWVASFTHGVLLLVSALLFPALLNHTPLACLAAILIVVGYQLTTPKLYRSVYRLGFSQFIPFVVTVAAIVFTDLLEGVLLGLACGLFFVIRSNHHSAISVVARGRDHLVRFNKDVTFVNKGELRQKLRAIEAPADVLFDGTKALYIDRDIMETVDDFRKMADFQGTSVELRHFEGKTPGPREVERVDHG